MDTHKAHAPGWVYNLADYRQMFDLTDADLQLKILDYPGGISSVNAELSQINGSVVSGDQFYEHENKSIKDYADKILQQNISHLHNHKAILQQSSEQATEQLIAQWAERKAQFLTHFNADKNKNHYKNMRMPVLPLENHEFQLALCSDLLFHTQGREGYSPEQLIEELCRVALEVRVYPLLNENGAIAPTLGPVMLHLQEHDFGVEVRSIAYHELSGGNAMLRIWNKKCVVSA